MDFRQGCSKEVIMWGWKKGEEDRDGGKKRHSNRSREWKKLYFDGGGSDPSMKRGESGKPETKNEKSLRKEESWV